MDINFSCVLMCKRYEFLIENEQPSLVVEGYISDKSYNETLQYPGDGRCFSVKISYTSDVINRRGPLCWDSLAYDNGGEPSTMRPIWWKQ